MTEAGKSSDVDETPTKAVSLFSEKATSGEQLPIWLLLAAHVGLGPFFCIWAAIEEGNGFVLPSPLIIPLYGFVLAQTLLLTFWTIFSSAAWWIRLTGLVVGSIYLEFTIALGIQTPYYDLLPAMVAVGGTAVFGAIRWRCTSLRRFSQKTPQRGQEGVKFSIRGLMLFTFVVAVMIIGVREFRENVPGGVPELFEMFVWSLCILVTGVAATWVGLGLARPMLGNIGVSLLSAILGALFVYGIIQGGPFAYFYITLTMVLQAAVLIASLLVVRSCGYRLVRRSADEVELLDGAEKHQLI